MHEQPRRGHEPDTGTGGAREKLASKILDEPSLFVASVVDLLTKRATDESRRAVESLRQAGAVTGREFSSFVDANPHPEIVSEIVWAYSYITKRVVDVDIAQGFPALLSLARHALTAKVPLNDLTQRRLFHILDRVLDARMADDAVAEPLQVTLSPVERQKLEDICARAPQDRKGYWEAIELLCAINPDIASLDCLVNAVDRIGARRYTKIERGGVQRCVSALAAGDFPNTFERLARAIHEGSRRDVSSLVDAVSVGLAFHADRTVGALCRYLSSGDVAFGSLACSVCISIDADDEVELSHEERRELRHEMAPLVQDEPREGPQVSRDLALAALAHISPVQDDIERVGREVLTRLRAGESPPSGLLHAYAEGLSRVEGEAGIVGFKPLSWKRVAALSSNPPLQHGAGVRGRGVIAPDTEHVFENLALEIGAVSEFDAVVDLCRRHGRFVDPRALSPRPSDSLSLFYDVADAARFTLHYADLCERGPIEFAAILFPEFLSALERGRSAEKESVNELIGEHSLRAVAALTSVLINNKDVRETATARLSSADWEALSSVHKRVEGDFSNVYPDLGLAVFALRATIEDKSSWQRALLRWWKGVDGRSRDSMDPNALAFVSVAAERSVPGAAIGLLKRLSLTTEDAQTFRDIAIGLIVRPEASVQKVIDFVSSSKAGELARGLLLSQLLARYLSDAQRSYIIGVAKRSMDEMGILSLDAVSTIGVLSRTPSDALMLLQSSPSLGISAALHRVSTVRAARLILWNGQRRS